MTPARLPEIVSQGKILGLHSALFRHALMQRKNLVSYHSGKHACTAKVRLASAAVDCLNGREREPLLTTKATKEHEGNSAASSQELEASGSFYFTYRGLSPLLHGSYSWAKRTRSEIAGWFQYQITASRLG